MSSKSQVENIYDNPSWFAWSGKISLARVAKDAARHEIRRTSCHPLPSSSSLLFRRRRSPFRSPARPLPLIPRSRTFVGAAAVTAARPLLHIRSA